MDARVSKSTSKVLGILVSWHRSSFHHNTGVATITTTSVQYSTVECTVESSGEQLFHPLVSVVSQLWPGSDMLTGDLNDAMWSVRVKMPKIFLIRQGLEHQHQLLSQSQTLKTQELITPSWQELHDDDQEETKPRIKIIEDITSSGECSSLSFNISYEDHEISDIDPKPFPCQ